MNKILLVEDDPVLGRSLSIKLQISGYPNVWVSSLREAEARWAQPDFSLVLLDVGLPDGNGLDFLKMIRESSPLPVLVLTARADEDSAVESLESGATDFIRKPFGSRELEARIKKALSEPLQRESQLRVGEITVLLDQRRVMYQDGEVEFNRREFDFFYFLAQHLDRVVSRETLIANVGKNSDISDRTIDSHMSHIRTKLKEKGVASVRIVPVYGVGYRMEKA